MTPIFFTNQEEFRLWLEKTTKRKLNYWWAFLRWTPKNLQ